MLGRQGAEPLERAARADQVAELTPRDGPCLREQERVVPVLGARGGLLGDRQDAIPVAPLLAVRLAQEEKRPLVVRVELERLLEEARAHVDVLVSEHPARAERQREPRARAHVGGLLEHLALRLLERIEAPVLGEQPFVQRRDLTIGAAGGVRARQQPLHLVGREAARDAGGAQEEPRFRGGVGRLVRAANQTGQVLLPGARLDLHVGEARARLRILATAHPEAARVRRRGLLVIAQIAEHIAQLQEKRAGVRPVGAGLQLELEQLLDHVQLAELPVHAARGLEALGQRRVELVGVLEVLERFDAGEELGLEDAPELQVKLRLLRAGRTSPDPFLQLLDEALPVADVLQVRKTLL
jgi:hypothetical protein